MYRVHNFKTAKEFVDFNEDFIYSNPMQHIFLISVINAVAKNQLQVFQAFNLVGNNEVQILILIVNDRCLIYCNQFDSNYIDILSEELPFEKLRNFLFAGDKMTIENLLHRKNLQFQIEKHLITYKCEKLNSNFTVSTGMMRFAKPSDLNYLAKLSVDFAQEYNDDKESLDDMKIAVRSEILAGDLFVWDDGDICAMAVKMNRQNFDYPEIGKLFTVANFRNKGYSSSLLYKLTEKILFNHSFCMLYTNGENRASNRACIKIGYLQVAEYAKIRFKS